MLGVLEEGGLGRVGEFTGLAGGNYCNREGPEGLGSVRSHPSVAAATTKDGAPGSSYDRFISGVNSFLAADEREHGSLRVLALDDPAAAGYLHGAIDDLAAAGFDSLDGCFD